MDENRKKRPAKKPENPVREWISDNLRYILLIAIIAVAAILIFVMVRALMGNSDTSTSVQSSVSVVSESSETSNESSSSTVSDSSTISESSTSESSVTSDSSQEDETTVSSSSTETSETSTQTELETASADVTTVINTYLSALAAGDADTAASVLETLDDEDRAAISQGLFANSYNNAEVYTYPGDVDGSYVVFVQYDYTYSGYSTSLPALTQFYVFTKDDGSLCIASEATQETKADYIASVTANEDVQTLISTVQGEYDAALASDSALAAYVASLSA